MTSQEFIEFAKHRRKAEYLRHRDWLIKARLNGWIK